MSIIIRLQNLPWSANAADIRRYFSGQSIPEGGVHIVGGEMGDAFIAFSTDEDARLAMAKDGGKIKDMQIKLLLSSRTEMMRVIEQARQQNMVVTQPPVVVSQPPIMTMPQPPRIVTSSSDSDRRRGRSPSPPPRRSRDRSPTRDRRRSPDDRRMSKRERSRSPRSSRNFNRDMDRRSDRFRRDDRHYDDSRYRDDRRPRESSVESKKYSDSADHDSRSQFHAPEGFRNMQSTYDQTSNPSMAGFYAYGNPQSNTGKNFSETFIPAPPNPPAQTSQMERSAPQKLLDFPPISNQNQPPSSTYSHDQMQFRGTPFESSVPLTKTDPDPSVEQQVSKSRRRSRFEPEFVPPTSSSSRFPSTHVAKPSIENQPYSNVTHAPQNYSETRSSWPLEVTENDPWNEKHQGPISKNGDLVQVVPMDIDPLPAESTPEKETYETLPIRNSSPFLRGNASPRNEDLRKENQNRGHVQNNNPVLSMQDRVPMPQNENRVMPMRNDMSGRIPPSLTVEVRGLPPDARIDDILDLFQGIPLPAANIRIEANEQGFEKAYIRFVSATDFEEALNRNRRFMHERRCELVPCPAVAFDSARTQSSQRSRPKLKPRDEDLTVQLRGLPFSCKDDDVVRFFDGLGILDLYVDIAPDGRASGSGFVEFGTQEDFRAALTMNGKLIGHRYITVSVASKEMMAFARGDDYTPNIQPTRQEPQHHSNQHFPNNRPPQFSPGPGQNQVRPNLNNQNRPSAPPVNQTRQGSPQTQPRPPPSISLKNLPEGVNNRDIADFLSQMNVVLRAIHIMLRPDKTPSGDAFAELAGPEDLEAALELNGSLMKGRRISVQPIPFHEMAEIVGRPGPPMPPPPAPGALLRTPGNIERPRRPLLPQGPPAEGTFRERPRLEPPSRGPRPRMDPFKGNMEPVRPYGSARARGPRPQRGSRVDSRFPPPAAERGIKDFGSPGCVVSIHNLHFQAGLEELLDFFRDYNLSKDNIIRKYNESGQTTGEARVAFQTPRDAQKAVRELNRKSIMGRPLSLMVL